MKYKSLSLCDLLAPILYAATVALGGAIPVHMLFSIEEGIAVRQISASGDSLLDALSIF